MRYVTVIIFVLFIVNIAQTNLLAVEIIEEVETTEQLPNNNAQVQPKTKKAKKAKKVNQPTLKQAADAFAAGIVTSIGNQLVTPSNSNSREVVNVETKVDGVSDSRSQYKRKLID